MGNIIRIKEGGLPKAFDAAKLRTNLQGGGNCLWIPKESVPVASKFINENGTYLAAAEGLHGFSSLNVSSQPDYVVGNKGGKTYHVHKGGTTGNELIYDELPEYIRITKIPSIEEIQAEDYRNLEVKAYKENGDIWENREYPSGIIPINELTIRKAKYSKYESMRRWLKDHTGNEYVINSGPVRVYNKATESKYTGKYIVGKATKHLETIISFKQDMCYALFESKSGYKMVMFTSKNAFDAQRTANGHYKLKTNDNYKRIYSDDSRYRESIDEYVTSETTFPSGNKWDPELYTYDGIKDWIPYTFYEWTEQFFGDYSYSSMSIEGRYNWNAAVTNYGEMVELDIYYPNFEAECFVSKADYIASVKWPVAITILYGNEGIITDWERPLDNKVLRANAQLVQGT